ncbi:hypothetical protein EON67_09955 [archaeon]|nr:MAG: hypothetical protein EON67_09955 [archaeon]
MWMKSASASKAPRTSPPSRRPCTLCSCRATCHACLPPCVSPRGARLYRLADNTYIGAFGAAGWGYKANEILSKVKGKDFRHEKTKKKRGTYRGGAIDMNAVNSIKLD